jgi:hypothetical protein
MFINIPLSTIILEILEKTKGAHSKIVNNGMLINIRKNKGSMEKYNRSEQATLYT